MSTKGETWIYVATITLSTTEGELPTDEEVEQLITDQMSGELDEKTGLFCISVNLQNRRK